MIERNGYFLRWVRGRRQRHGSSAHGGSYVYVHRLVIEEHLGRQLEACEVVHHINGDTHDNRIDNLELLSGNAEHRHIHRDLSTACQRGHPWTPESTYIRPGGTRECRNCMHLGVQRREAARS